MKPKNDLTNKRFERLVALYKAPEKYYGATQWMCRCDCGNYKAVPTYRLISGSVKSCGCLKKDAPHERFTTHGLTHHPLFSVWDSMKKRCYNPNCKGYPRYGGRGIKVCDEWLHDFKAFYDWAIASGYEKGLTIERIDVNGNYEPQNCCWITWAEQAKNRRTTLWIIYKGKKINSKDFADLMGVSRTAVATRAYKGISGDEMAKEFETW